MRLTVDEYSKQFKMSKEMIKSRLKTKKLNYIIEDGVTYIITSQTSDETVPTVLQTKKETSQNIVAPVKQKTTVATILALYQRENKQLKEKIQQLEEKIDRLINDKEQMLRDERDKIESIYSAKDEQLKNVLELINAKMKLEQEQTPELIHEVATVSLEQTKKESKKNKKNADKVIELREYLKTLSLKSYQRKIIKKRFLAVYDSDIRIIQQNGKLYLDFSKYDYSDLLEY